MATRFGRVTAPLRTSPRVCGSPHSLSRLLVKIAIRLDTAQRARFCCHAVATEPTRSRTEHRDHALVWIGEPAPRREDLIGDRPVMFLDVVDVAQGHGDRRVPQPRL